MLPARLPARLLPGACLALLFVPLFATPPEATLRLDFESPVPPSVRMEVAPGNSADIIDPGTLPPGEAFAAPSGRHVQRLVWRQASYDGTRLARGVEGRSTASRITREGWYGLRFRVAPDWPMQQRCFLAQMICWTSEFPRTNKTLAIAYTGDGRLSLVGFYGDVEASERYNDHPDPTADLPLGRLEPGRWHEVVIHVRYSRSGDGFARAWLDAGPAATGLPAPSAEIHGIRLGNGAWNTDTELRHGSYQKWGVYAYAAKHYTPGETRTLYYDDVAYVVGEAREAWRAVWPGHAAPSAPAAASASPAPQAEGSAAR